MDTLDYQIFGRIKSKTISAGSINISVINKAHTGF